MKTFGTSDSAKNGFVTERVLAAFHHKGQPVVNALVSLLLQITTPKIIKIIKTSIHKLIGSATLE